MSTRVPARPSLGDDIRGPAIALTEERAGWHLHDVGGLPNHDPHFHAVRITERRPCLGRIGEFQDDVDTLFFNAER